MKIFSYYRILFFTIVFFNLPFHANAALVDCGGATSGAGTI